MSPEKKQVEVDRSGALRLESNPAKTLFNFEKLVEKVFGGKGAFQFGGTVEVSGLILSAFRVRPLKGRDVENPGLRNPTKSLYGRLQIGPPVSQVPSKSNVCVIHS